MRRRTHVGVGLALMLAVAAGACASGSGGGSGSSSSRDVIDMATLDEYGNDTAYRVISRLNSRWLQPQRGATISANEGQPVQVYVNGIRQSGVDDLRNINASQIREIRYMDPREASRRWGPDHGSGAIMVTLR